MEIFIFAVVVIAAFAAGWVIADATDSLAAGALVGILVAACALLALGGLVDEAKADARVNMAATQCVRTVTSADDWADMSVRDMRAAAEEAVSPVGLESGKEQVDAVDSCHAQLIEQANNNSGGDTFMEAEAAMDRYASEAEETARAVAAEAGRVSA